MKSIVKTLIAASLSIAAVSACSEEKLSPSTTGTKTTVHFGATSSIVDGATKATLTTEDENKFIGSWENGDMLSVRYHFDYDENGVGTTAIWNGSSFDAELPSSTGDWIYYAAYPAPTTSDNSVDFGSARTQKGNAYNSKYDIMIGSAEAENAAAGKDDEGNNIVFKMERKTAIAYFHLTSNLDESITSATLSVSGDNAFIASNYAYVSNFEWAPTEDCKSITITFPEEAPNAKEFQLWFNVLATKYESISLVVETATKTLTINNTTSGEYIAGHLYKVKGTLSADKWVSKGESEEGFVLVTKNEADWTGSYLLVGNNGNDYYAYDESINGSDFTWGKSSNVTIDNNVIPLSFSSMALEIVNGTVEGTYSIMTPSGKYLSASAVKKFNLTDKYSSDDNDFIISYGESNDNVVITLSSNNKRQIRYNYNGGSGGFRWYDATTANSISLYKGPSVSKYMVSFSAVAGGVFSASVIKALEGTEITLIATPDTGYEFNNDWSVKDAAGSDITVTDGKFTMPASNVTVTGSFTQLSYAITKSDAVGGSFAVMNGETEVSSAHYNDVITLKATPDEGYEFTSWTVAYKDGSTDKSFSPNGTFNMPASDVTVSAKFTEVAKIPVYASLADLIAAGAPTSSGTQVTVTLTDEVITKFYKIGNYTNGVFFNVGEREVQIYCRNTPSEWKIGGTVSGTLTNCLWKLYSGTWELCPDDYTELTYVAPLESCEAPSIVLDGATATITCATDGATIHYTVGDSPADPTAADAVYTSPVTLTDGQTIKAIAVKEGMLNSSISSKKYVEESVETKVLIIDGAQLSSTATTSESVLTIDGTKITLSKGAKSQKSSSAKNSFSNNGAILIGKKDAYIYNSSAIPGVITKFEVYTNDGASAKVSVGINFSKSPITKYSDTGAWTQKLSNLDSVYDCSSKLSGEDKYFWFQVTNSNNSQVQFRITYIPE